MDFNHRPSASQTDALYGLSYTSMAETERFERSQALARHLSGVLPYQLGDASRMEEGRGSNPEAFNPRAVFRTVYPHGCYPPEQLVHTGGLEPPKAEARCSTGTRICRSATYAKKETQLSKIKKSEFTIPVVESTRS